ncbi:hypothetical protein EJ04DRAFT_507160 [Polyplosphaeria fusca]|uniref:Uncharacterized protein n=1 Tax=Polyplosphaeria fusca TaxID=682080 RepID=A0A9P4RAT5_9PLEO|nr:hypothetical protein EJ04DRAFT_507160 [Polyplosphaeria fusca]
MRPSQMPIPRIQLVRQILRPPAAYPPKPSIPRPFSHRPPRFLVSHATPRPQLPFLSPISESLSSGHYRLAHFITISDRSKKFIKDTAKQTVKWTAIIWVFTTCFSIASMGFLSERQERAFPSPHEWSLYTRIKFRRGKWYEVPENDEEYGFTNWAKLYAEYAHALRRLENPSKDGHGIKELDEGEFVLPDGSKAGLDLKGFDFTEKSEEWRQGYWEVLMGMGRAAERTEGWVTDRRKRSFWTNEFVESPSNPRPKAPPPGTPPVPPKEKQIPISEPAETFWLRILTSKGFTTSQRMEAALAYGDHLSYKKLSDSAEEMYRWALDIAISGLPPSAQKASIDQKTAVLNAKAPKETITQSIVQAATSLAIHFASKGDISSALPIFVSVLRARLSADLSPNTQSSRRFDSSITATLMGMLTFSEAPYPPLPPTGNEPLLRSPEDMCDEAALKNYIGEILFTTAGSSISQRTQALNWIREAVSNAKAAQSIDSISAELTRKRKCQVCEEVGLENWGKIMTFLAADAKEQLDRVHSGGLTGKIGKIWGTKELEQKAQDLEDEEWGVMMRLSKLRKKMLTEDWDDRERKFGRIFVF